MLKNLTGIQSGECLPSLRASLPTIDRMFMTSKRWTLVGGAVACLIAALHASALHAAPWLEPGDIRARFAVQKLADRGHLNRPVTTWPINWSALENGTGSLASNDLPSVGMASAYLRFEREQQAAPGLRTEFSLNAQSEIPAVTGFETNALAKAGASVNLQWQGETWAFGLKPTYARDPDDNEEVRPDGSYLAATTGNWVFGAGTIDRWWGPGWQSSLILSNNARPVPSVWITRNDTAAPETPFLDWLGPWNATLLVGQYENDRAVPRAKLIGMRFSFRPVAGLDIGLSRAIMVGGEGRSESASTIADALIGRDNSQEGADNDPGNQLGSLDVRYGFSVGQQSMGVYAEMMGEDEAGAFPARKSWQFGTDWTSQLFNADQQWFVEYTNTLADDFLGNAMPNISYEHFQYRSGYRYNGRNMATSFEGDAEALTLGAYHFFGDGSNLTAKTSYAELNKDGRSRVIVPTDDIFYTVPARNQNVAIVQLGYGTEAFSGWLDLSLQATDKEIEYVSGKKDQISASARWTYRY